MIDENILQETLLVQKMIYEFFEEKCGEFFKDEHREALKDVFDKVSVSYGDIESFGLAEYETKKITIKESLTLNTERVISYLIHEYCHMFINRDFEKNKTKFQKTFDEGMCDTLSDLVVNYYFEKNQNVIFNGRKLNIKLPYDSYSCYLFQNSWIRSLLYPLEKSNRDKEAIVELVLGNPVKFFEITMGKEYSDSLKLNGNGFPTEPGLSYKLLYTHNKEAFHDIDENSFYYRRNFILPAFILQQRIENLNCTPIYELGNSYYNEYFISNDYFKGKKIYEIDSIELSEFIKLYNLARCPQHKFIDGIIKFIDLKAKELTQEELSEHSYLILKNYSLIMSEVEKMGTCLGNVLTTCLSYELNKMMNNQVDADYIRKLHDLLYCNLQKHLKVDECDTSKNIYEIISNYEILFDGYIVSEEEYNPRML